MALFSPKCKITHCTNKGTGFSATKGLTFKGLAMGVEILLGTKASTGPKCQYSGKPDLLAWF